MTCEQNTECAQFLVQGMARIGSMIDVYVGDDPPARYTTGPYATDPFICPHRVPHWIVPTEQQIAAWARDGVA